MPVYNTYNCISCGKLNENKPNSKKYCNNKCQQYHQLTLKINLWLDNKNPKVRRNIVREWLIRNKGNKCNICQIENWQGKKITFWVDHIDGNASNNSPTNFQLVCPNCDSQQPTFGAKNWGKGRKARGLPQYG